jgi:DNA polymerase III delta prime subunit
MHVNCSLGKGIKFVREDLKNFAKSNINTSHGIFKSVVLYNADYLTIDAIRATAVYRDI